VRAAVSGAALVARGAATAAASSVGAKMEGGGSLHSARRILDSRASSERGLVSVHIVALCAGAVRLYGGPTKESVWQPQNSYFSG